MYSHLEGKKIKMLHFEGGEVIGLVVGCDRDIGITIVSAEDHNNYLLCLVGPSTSQWTDNTAVERYKLFFDKAVNLIISGTFNGHEYLGHDAGPSRIPPSIDTCAFM